MIPARFSQYRQATDRQLPGQAIIEFAMASMVFLTIIFGTIDFGRAIFIKSELENAAREAARVGKINPTNHWAIRTAAINHASGTGLIPGAITISCNGSCVTGNSLTVTTTVTFRAVTQDVLGIEPLTLSSSATVDIE